MSRHRHVQNLNYDEEYDAACDDAIYGHSVDEHEVGVSPSVASYLYSQEKGNYGIGAYFVEDNIAEENEDKYDEENESRSSISSVRTRLSSEDEVRVNSILDEIRNAVGDEFSDSEMVRSVLANEYNFEKSLDSLLSSHIPKQSDKKSSSSSATKGRLPVPGEGWKPKPSASLVVVDNSTKTGVKGFELKQNGVGESSGQANKRSGNTLSSPSEEKDIVTPSKLTVKLRDKAVDVEKKYLEYRAGSNKLRLNLVVVGHVDAGKSTMMGHLLYLKGNVSQKLMHKYEKESKRINKQSFMYAWILDETEEERSRGVTVDIAESEFETDCRHITLLDAPGHRDFIPNMITGAARADVAVLVVDASIGGFEAGFESGGQTREHAILVRSLGLSQLAIAVNKMDMVKWAETRFEEIKERLKIFFKTVGFRDSDVIYVPCSGLEGENLISESTISALSWYKGPTLLQAIDNLKVPKRDILKPIRMCINNFYKSFSSMNITGRLEGGYIQNGDRLIMMPHGEPITVRGVSVIDEEPGFAFAGDSAIITFTGVDPALPRAGDFICDPQYPIPLAIRIEARIVVFNVAIPIIKGSLFDIHYQCVREEAYIKKLISLMHKSTGEVIKKHPRFIPKNSSAIVELTFARAICLETFCNFKEFGRFMLRTSGQTVAAGMVTKIIA